MSLLPVAEAQARLLAMRPALPAEELALDDCIGRWLAKDVVALRDQPSADLSAMDGYAMRADNLSGPWKLVGESAAGGSTPPAIARGETVRIFTGAPLPPEAGTILIQENAVREADRISLLPGSILTSGLSVRARQSDFAEGQVLIQAGRFAGPAQIALTAMSGNARLSVGARPRVAILSTGSELVPVGRPLMPGQIPSSNAPMLQAMLAPLPCATSDLGVVPDTLGQHVAMFDRARTADIIVTTGGASVGDHDLVRPALLAAGGSVDFWKIKVRPGKPLIVGKLGDAIFIGLPGNPVSAFVTAILFLLPLVRHLAGSLAPLPPTRMMPLGAPLPAGGSRDEYVRATVRGGHVHPIGNRDSASLTALAAADALIVRPADCPASNPDDAVEVVTLY
jgi:molybdopterin molybdotransferase